MIEVLKGGLQTTVQEYPGRQGLLRHGVPPSGPLDDWSFRLANLVVGNEPGTAALECQFLGPTLRLTERALISVCGGDFSAKIDSAELPMWTAVQVEAGQVLSLGPSRQGARAYIAFAGGIDVPTIMGSRSTYVIARIGGLSGSPLAAGQNVRLGTASATAAPGRFVRPSCRPAISSSKSHDIAVVLGPKNDWISPRGHELFFSTNWQLSSRSNRVGFRIQGPQLDFTERAYIKSPENGEHPSNIIDIGYPLGGINLAGETPIILMHDCITLGGFIVPYTVPSSEFWKLAQAGPGHSLRFAPISIDQAQASRSALDLLCSPDSIDAAA